MTDRYTFDSTPHGAGGFGKVIKGHDNALDRNVAIKVLSGLPSSFSEADKDRFRREARILAKLSHPNIPAIYDVVGFDNGNLLIIFQFVEGKNLRQVLTEQGACQLGEVKTWFHQIASGLEYAHGNGIIHRDVKPENVIITPDRESAYLVDFGIALTTEDSRKLTERGYAIGTPGYMSPEQVAGKELDSRTDIYSLGVTLYEALAGKRIPVGDYQDLAATNESLPPQLDELVRDCLLPVDRRVSSARAFSTRLAGALRPLKPLSEVLSHGRLHEIAAALEELTPDEFARLAAGQRALILLKCDDIVGSGEEELGMAGARFLELLLMRAILLPEEEYRGIVQPAFPWALEHTYYGKQGSVTLQLALERAATDAHASAHTVIAKEAVAFLDGIALEEKPNWYLQALRKVLTALMANPACTSNVPELGEYMRRVNRVQRGR